jgi:hypothetical protein
LKPLIKLKVLVNQHFVANMIRPERMTATSIIMVRQDAEQLLEALSGFGEFHIEQAAEKMNISEYTQSIQKVGESQSNVNE